MSVEARDEPEHKPTEHTEPTERGIWIAFEGSDGSGKSTQAALLSAAIGAVASFEPGATAIGASLRGIVLHTDAALNWRAEALLYAADRAQHVEEIVEPALCSGRHVVTDRSVWSSVVYQGIARGLGVDEIINVNDFASAGRWPDLVVLLDCPQAERTARLDRELDRMERSGDRFFERVRRGFLDLSGRYGWVVLDATEPVGAIHAEVVEALAERFGVIASPTQSSVDGDRHE